MGSMVHGTLGEVGRGNMRPLSSPSSAVAAAAGRGGAEGAEGVAESGAFARAKVLQRRLESRLREIPAPPPPEDWELQRLAGVLRSVAEDVDLRLGGRELVRSLEEVGRIEDVDGMERGREEEGGGWEGGALGGGGGRGRGVEEGRTRAGLDGGPAVNCDCYRCLALAGGGVGSDGGGGVSGGAGGESGDEGDVARGRAGRKIRWSDKDELERAREGNRRRLAELMAAHVGAMPLELRGVKCPYV